MARRTSPQRWTDELRFPVRIRVKVPPSGLGQTLSTATRWLNEEVGSSNYANWPIDSLHGQATAFHFRTIEDAARFCAAFPMFSLADGMATGRRDVRQS